ncbi:MAG: hypothetical protein JWN41_1716, partial [Thermoleophilia bacterium]|nr:hypothetical protein [Thermoleophilia bacterium]
LALVRVGNAASGAARRPALLAVGGALAACAVLVKQSAFDAAVAGTIVLAVGIVRKHTWELRDLAAWLGGALVPVAATLTWAAQTHHMHALWNATVLFRYDVVGALGPESGAASAGVGKLVAPLIASGLVLLLALALVALVTKVTAPHRLLMVAWLTAGVVGILGGGFFWPHYLIEVVPVLCVAAGVLLGGSRSPALARWAVVAVLISCTIAGHWTRQLMPHSGHSDDSARAVGLWVSRHASRGDELLVIYARPGVVHASGLRSTSPYLWSAMQATRADNRRRIVKALRAEDPPEWVVRWDASDAYGLDSDGAILHDLSERYRVVGHVRRRDVLRLIHERDRS